MGTNKFVFSVLGINKNSAYGNIVIPLKDNIINTAMSTPIAATYFNNFQAGTNTGPVYYGALCGRVWVDAKRWTGMDGDAGKDYKSLQIRGNEDTYGVVFALEMLARVMAYHRGNLENKDYEAIKKNLGNPDPTKVYNKVSAEEVRKYMKAVDSHSLVEVHIPPFSADEIYKVVLWDLVYDSLAHPLKNIPDDKFVKVVAIQPIATNSAINQLNLMNKSESYSAP